MCTMPFFAENLTSLSSQAIFSDGKVKEGAVDTHGRSPHVASNKKEKVKVLAGGKTWHFMANLFGGSQKDPVLLQFGDATGEPIVGLKYQIKAGDATVSEGETDGKGQAKFTYEGEHLPLLCVEKLSTKEMKPLCRINNQAIRELVLISPKIMKEVELQPDGASGSYLQGTYHVQKGDDLESIAKKFNVHLIDLIFFNEWDSKPNLVAGEVIKVPPQAARSKS